MWGRGGRSWVYGKEIGLSVVEGSWGWEEDCGSAEGFGAQEFFRRQNFLK